MENINTRRGLSTGRAVLWASSAAVALAAGCPALAQANQPASQADDPAASDASSSGPGLDDIVVTARKRAEDVQDVPLSISAVSGAALERRGITNVRELASFVPSLALIGQNNNRAAIIQIRGIGSAGLNLGIEPDVGVYFDGVYQKQAATVLQSNLLDIEAIEVLRGPQGTLYGRNTPVGAVIVRSRAPSHDTEAMIQGGIGNFGLFYTQGYIGGGLADNVAARISFFGSSIDGYDFNTATLSRINGNHQYGGRARIRWEPSERTKIDLIGYYTYVQSKCCVADNIAPFGPRGIATPGFLAAIQAASGRPYTNFDGRDHIVDTSDNPLEFIKNFGMSLSAETELSDALSLTSITAYSGTRMVVPRSTATGQPITVIATSFDSPIDSYSQELRLSSTGDSRLQFQLGLYGYYEDASFHETRTADTVNRVFATGPQVQKGEAFDYYFDQRTYSISGYGQLTYSITPSLRINAGARYSYDNKKVFINNVLSANASRNFAAQFPNYAAPNLRLSESKPTWLLGAQYDATDAIMLYANYATGWKSGGFSGRPASVGSPLGFKAETAENFEVGVKSKLFDNRAIVNVSLFKLKVSGFQESIYNPVTGVGFIVGNAGNINAKGVEGDIQLRPFDGLLLNGSFAYLDSEYAGYSAGPCYSGATPNGSKPNTCSYNGKTPAYSPKWKTSLGAEYSAAISDGLRGFVRGDMSYTSAQNTYTALDPRSVQKGYTLFSGRIGFESADGKWRASLWGKNLSDVYYVTASSAVPNGTFLSGGGTSGVSGPLNGYSGPPRTFGVEVSLKY